MPDLKRKFAAPLQTDVPIFPGGVKKLFHSVQGDLSFVIPSRQAPLQPNVPTMPVTITPLDVKAEKADMMRVTFETDVMLDL